MCLIAMVTSSHVQQDHKSHSIQIIPLLDISYLLRILSYLNQVGSCFFFLNKNLLNAKEG